MPSDTAAPRRRQEQRRSEAEQALLDAGVRLFARQGVDATSMADIGAEAGFSRGLANHHFGSRAAFVQRLAAHNQQEFISGLPDLEADVEAVVAVADRYLARIVEDGERMRAFFVMWGASFAEASPLREVFIIDDGRFREGVELLVRASQEAGTIRRDVDPVGFAAAFVALLRGIGAQVLVSPESVDVEAARRCAEELVRARLTPIGGQKATPRRQRRP
jgi:AcrR family transcriptional regulator